MYDPTQTALVPLSVTAVSVRGRPQPMALYGVAATGLASISLFLGGWPVFSMLVLAVSAMASLVLGAMTISANAGPQRAMPVEPEAITSGEVRETYRAILFGIAEVERTIAVAPRLRRSVAPVLERCRAVVQMSGRMALCVNPLQHYLDNHAPGYLRSELDRLRGHAETATDDVTVSALSQAAATRMRQLALYDQIAARRDRILARLELVRAALETFAAMLVNLQALDEEEVALAGESVAEHLDEIGGDLEVLESAFDLAA